MTKEEFINIINVEIEKIEKELAEATKPVDYYEKIAPGSVEHQDAITKFNAVKLKLGRIKRCINLPAYARIQSMSAVEIGKYKDEKIAEIDVQIQGLEVQKNHEQQKFEQLKKEEQELIAKFASASESEKEAIIDAGKQLHKEIDKYDINKWNSIFATLDREIRVLENQQTEIRNRDIQVIKNELSAKIDGHESLKDLNEDFEISPSSQLLAEFADDFEKQKQVAKLLAKHSQLKDEEDGIVGTLFLDKISEDLKQRISLEYCYDVAKNALKDPVKMMEIILGYEYDFDEQRKIFNEQFTEEKLLELCDDYITSSEINVGFLELHYDKIDKELPEELAVYYNKRELLRKKTFKTSSVRAQIKSLDYKISDIKNHMYAQIISWYTYFNRRVLGINDEINFEDRKSVKDYLKKANIEIENTKESIENFRKRVNDTGLKMEEHKTNLQNERKNIVEQIKALATNDYKDATIEYYSSNVDSNLDYMNSVSSWVYQQELINNIYDEARAQAQAEDEEILAQKRL